MRAKLKLFFICVIAFPIGLALAALNDGNGKVGVTKRPDAMLSLFKDYCAPFHSGERVFFSDELIEVASVKSSVTVRDPISQIEIIRGPVLCSVSDEPATLKEHEQEVLDLEFVKMVAALFPDFVQERSGGSVRWQNLEVWSNGEQGEERAGVFLAREVTGGPTVIGIGTPKAPTVALDEDGWPRF